jgi:hypothetical protein
MSQKALKYLVENLKFHATFRGALAPCRSMAINRVEGG